MINKRAFFQSLFAKLDNSIYVIGGSDSNNTDLASCEKFSLAENVWRPIASMNIARNGTGATIFEQCRLIFVFGGNSHVLGSLNKVEKYEIDFDKWTVVDIELKKAIHDLTAFPVSRERVLIFGGHTDIEESKLI
jgi:N-acetylneuraminic acid mutarotase